MKLYRVKQGTKGKVIRLINGAVQDWTTTKDLSFVDTVIDPVRYHNQRSKAVAGEPEHLQPLFVELAQQGYSVFYPSMYAARDSFQFALVVKYDDVSILA